MKCPNCGKERDVLDTKCKYCHQKFKDTSHSVDFSEIFKIQDEEEYENIEELFKSSREKIEKKRIEEDKEHPKTVHDETPFKDATQFYDVDEINELLEESQKHDWKKELEEEEEKKEKIHWTDFFKEEDDDLEEWFQKGDLFTEEKKKARRDAPQEIKKEDYEGREVYYYAKKAQNIFLKAFYKVQSFFFHLTNRWSLFVRSFLEKMIQPRSNISILTKVIYFVLTLLPIFHYLLGIYQAGEMGKVGLVFLTSLLTFLAMIYRLVVFEGTSILIKPQLSSTSFRVTKSQLGALGFAIFEFIFYFTKRELLFLSNALLTSQILTTRPFSFILICLLLAYFNYLLNIRNAKKENRWKILAYSFIGIFVISLILNLIGITILQSPIQSFL